MIATKGLGKNERAVAIAIAAHMNKAGDAWPSVATIAEYADCSERTVQRAIAKLITLGRLVWRRVADIPTRVYRLVVDAVQATAEGVASAARGVTNDRAGVTDQTAGGDSQGDTRSGEEDPKMKRAGARDWRRWIPTSKNPTGQRPTYPERRGAALPPPPGGDRCQKRGHLGQPADRCIPCRSETLGVTR
ncbi:helix-turn-helix domain-containing protein [Micromonospora sp. WP24]|uniref:helix-turn-helix domain-containing protein n=1 Tax=Micromonospora sp. WP24 TaxID=2604469 RepID=UPI001652236C|nr:helix-turn-helix domain-containing protein [Micromonospora sp. WP24]